MGGIMEVKSSISTKEFTLDYDRTKDKYYLSIVAFGEWITETFYGSWALEEYLRDSWSLTNEQIEELKSKAYEN